MSKKMGINVVPHRSILRRYEVGRDRLHDDVRAALAREQFRWAAAGWKVMAELPNPVNFDAYSQFVREEDIAQRITCGPEAEGIVEGVKQFMEAGFERVALVQVGDRQKEFCEFYERELAEALRAL